MTRSKSVRNWWTNLSVSEKMKRAKKISVSKKGKKLTIEHCKKISNALVGKPKDPFTREHKKKISKSLKGKVFTKKHKMNIRIAALKRAKRIGRWVSYNKDACEFFHNVNESFNIFGHHAENGGEHSIIGYSLDYYEPSLNLVIEWNEKHHYRNGKLTSKHKKRQKEIKRFLHCTFINIKQSTFKKEEMLQKIKKTINQIQHDRIREKIKVLGGT